MVCERNETPSLSVSTYVRVADEPEHHEAAVNMRADIVSYMTVAQDREVTGLTSDGSPRSTAPVRLSRADCTKHNDVT